MLIMDGDGLYVVFIFLFFFCLCTVSLVFLILDNLLQRMKYVYEFTQRNE